jgi:urea transport system ATP-binding protein
LLALPASTDFALTVPPIVLVEQYFEFAFKLADHFVVMRQGKLTLAGEKASLSKAELYDHVSV